MTPKTEAGRDLLVWMQEIVDWWRTQKDEMSPQYVDAFLSAIHNIEHSLPTIEAQAAAAAIERAKNTVLRREHEYLWTWEADKWSEEDMGHAAEMIGDFLGILDEEAAR